MKRASATAALAGALLLGAAQTGPAAAQDEKFKLGLVTFLTGPLAGPTGIPLRNGAELVVEAINAGTLPGPYAARGLGGREVEIILVDENGGATKQASEYRNLVQKRGAEAVLGYISAGTCLAIGPLAEELKTLTVYATCASPRSTEDTKPTHVFRTSAHATADGVAAARYVLRKFPKLETYAGINQNFAYGQDSWRDFTTSLQALAPNAKVVAEQFPNLGNNQYGADISALLAASPQVTHSSVAGVDLEGFLAQLSARGLQGRTQLVLTAGEAVLHRLGSKIPDGVIVGGRGAYGPFARDTELARWFTKAYFDRYNIQPNFTAYHGAQAVLGLKIAVDKAAAEAKGRPTPEQVVGAFRGISYDAFGTKVRMSLAGGHQAVTEHAMGVYKFDRATNQPTVTDVVYFAAECVNPPEGVKSADWIKSGFQGSQCPES